MEPDKVFKAITSALVKVSELYDKQPIPTAWAFFTIATLISLPALVGSLLL